MPSPLRALDLGCANVPPSLACIRLSSGHRHRAKHGHGGQGVAHIYRCFPTLLGCTAWLLGESWEVGPGERRRAPPRAAEQHRRTGAPLALRRSFATYLGIIYMRGGAWLGTGRRTWYTLRVPPLASRSRTSARCSFMVPWYCCSSIPDPSHCRGHRRPVILLEYNRGCEA